MAAEADIIRYVITGEEGEVIPENATHVSVHPSVRIISQRLFEYHRNIIELICHDGVIKIEYEAFHACRRLKRVIMKGVEEVEENAFHCCEALEYVECDKLEIIKENAFSWCGSMTSFNLPSAKTVRGRAFHTCPALVVAKFGNNLESIGVGGNIFYNCRSLERITIPLENDLFDRDDIFQRCDNLRHVDLSDEEVLQQTIDALLWEEWKNDMNAEVASIDQILPNAYAGNRDKGEKTLVIRQWITNVLHKIIIYKSQHRRILKEAAYRLQLALPRDIVMNNVVPFLKLPQHTFDGEEEIDDGDESIYESYSSEVDSDEEEDHHDGSEGGDSETEVNEEERRKRQRTENNGDDDVEGEND